MILRDFYLECMFQAYVMTASLSLKPLNEAYLTLNTTHAFQSHRLVEPNRTCSSPSFGAFSGSRGPSTHPNLPFFKPSITSKRKPKHKPTVAA